jgi:DNA-binding NarL/FixJ family response regulator
VSSRDDASSALAGALADADALRTHRSPDLADAVARLERASFDAILLDIGSGERGLGTLVKLRAQASSVPIVVLADPEHEAVALKSMMFGAQDYLLIPHVHATLLTRCLRHAIQQAGAVEEFERRAQESERSLPPDEAASGADVVARLYGAGPLRETAPDAFRELATRYAQLLDDAVDERTYRVRHGIADRLRAVADELGFLRAGPRDVVDLHTDAMRARAAEVGPRRLEACVAEGRLLIIELMGYLVSFYRRHSLAPRPLRPAAPAVLLEHEDRT